MIGNDWDSVLEDMFASKEFNSLMDRVNNEYKN